MRIRWEAQPAEVLRPIRPHVEGQEGNVVRQFRGGRPPLRRGQFLVRLETTGHETFINQSDRIEIIG
jgi:hypothetical protein